VVEVTPQQRKPVGVHLIDASGADSLVDHQPGVLQHLQVLRDGRPADRQLAGKLAYGARPLGETLEDRPARRVAESGPSVSFVSLHER
jgi:hypothetical protein